jgi:hypothetical protein
MTKREELISDSGISALFVAGRDYQKKPREEASRRKKRGARLKRRLSLFDFDLLIE